MISALVTQQKDLPSYAIRKAHNTSDISFHHPSRLSKEPSTAPPQLPVVRGGPGWAAAGCGCTYRLWRGSPPSPGRKWHPRGARTPPRSEGWGGQARGANKPEDKPYSSEERPPPAPPPAPHPRGQGVRGGRWKLPWGTTVSCHYFKTTFNYKVTQAYQPTKSQTWVYK